MELQKQISAAALEIIQRKPVLVSTGAGISVESGIPTFRGRGGLWEKYDPDFFEIEKFYSNPKYCWRKIKEIFYTGWGKFSPNQGHIALAEMQKRGYIHTLVTQNIDCLHQKAGSADVVEFHGTLGRVVCTNRRCGFVSEASVSLLEPDIPICPKCGKLLKPDVVFFGEAIPEEAAKRAFHAAENTDAVLVIGTSGTVVPANSIPETAKEHGALIIEINPSPSAFTNTITDIFLQGKSAEILSLIWKEISGCSR